MSAHENFDTTAELFGNFASFSSSLTINHNVITAPGDEKTLPDGSRVVTNEKGEVIFIGYAEGSTVMRFNDYVICKNHFSEHWFRTSNSNWFRLD